MLVDGHAAIGFIRDDTEVLLFKHSRQKLAAFGFRGTEGFNLNDWLKNFKVARTSAKIFRNMFKLHSGFNDRFEDISKSFRDQYKRIPNDYTIILTGLSLGGAMATIAGHLQVEY